jgi:hypothetical protein
MNPEEVRFMKCERCGGFTIDVLFSGGVAAVEGWEYDGWKCLNCGYVGDPLILENRAAQCLRRSGHPSPYRTTGGTPVGAQIAV